MDGAHPRISRTAPPFHLSRRFRRTASGHRSPPSGRVAVTDPSLRVALPVAFQAPGGSSAAPWDGSLGVPGDRRSTLKNMSQVGIRALKQNASAVVAEVVAGETVTITGRGRPVAQLSPIPSSPLHRLISAGAARPARRSIGELPAPQPGEALSDELATMRDAERY